MSAPVLVSHRVVDVPTFGASVSEHGVLHSRFRLIVQERKNVIEDPGIFSQVFRRRRDVPRSAILIPLAGRTVLRTDDGTHELSEGQCAVELRGRPWSLRKEADSAVLMVEWEPGLVSSRLVCPSRPAALSPGTLRRIQAASRDIVDPGADAEAASEASATIFAALRAEGFPFDPIAGPELREEVPTWASSLVRAVDATIRSLCRQPVLGELERALGWSERQIQRRIRELHQRYASFVDGGWRELQLGWRFVVGAALMSAPGATTENVAGALGYASPRAFCDSFANAGLPSPGAVRSALLED